MLKFKWLLPLVAILLVAAGVFAMNANKKYALEYWNYNGSAGQESIATNYSLGTSTPTHICGTNTTTVCQIRAEKDPVNPSQPKLDGKNPMVDKITFQTTLRADN
ncbi:MAG TPA: DUF6520 family protein [Niabella sp.]